MISDEIAIGMLVALGAGIMFLSILRTRQVLWLLKGSKYTHGWRILFSLTTFFLVGYVATLALVLAGITEILVILTGVIFFFGALFVYLVVRMGYLTINDLLRTTVSKDYWETTFNAMQDAVALVDRDHRIVQANQAFVDIAPGRSPQIMGQTYYTALNGATCPEADCPLEQTMQRGQPAKCVHEYGKRIFDVQTVPVLGGDVAEPGHVARMVYVMRDITERVRAEMEQEAARELLQTVIDGVNEPIMVIGMDYQVKLMNRAVREDYLGAGASAPVCCYQVSHHRDTPCDGKEHPCPLEQVRESLRTVTVVHEHYWQDGEKRFVEIIASPLFEEDGTLMGIIESARDITERKQAQEALRRAHDELEMRVQERIAELAKANEALQAEVTERKRAEEALKTFVRQHAALFQLSADLAITRDEAGVCREVVRGLHDTLVYDYLGLFLVDETTGERVLRASIGWPDAPANWRIPPGHGLSERPLLDGQLHYTPDLTRDPCYVPGLKSGAEVDVPLRIGEKVLGVLVVESKQPNAFDQDDFAVLTAAANQASLAIERAWEHQAVKEAEVRYRSLFDGVPVGLYRTTPAGQVLEANPVFVEMLGYPDQETLLAANTADSYVDAKDRQRWQALIEGKGVVSDFEVQLRRRDGRVIWVADSVRVVRDEDGRVLHYEGSLQDITERKRAEAALEKERALLARRVAERTAELSAANAELARAARLKDEFLASMSHELRTPLNAVLGLSEALQEEVYGPLNERQHKSLRTIEESGRHLLALINDILDVSKIEAGKLQLEIGPVSVESVCQASLGLIKQDAHKKQLKVSSTFDSAAEIVRADQRRLKQILVNLLSNAVKFTPEGGAIGLQVVGDAEQEVVHFSVWDSGIGISPEEMERLFQPFVQLDSSLSRQYTGTGLGLALVHRLTEMHGGGVSVESEVGKGSRFTVSLPWQGLAEAAGAIEEAVRRAHDRAEGAESGTPGVGIHRALIIEDSPAAAGQLSRYLAELGVETVVYPRGEGAVEEALKVHPDVIILDILLPDPSGWDVLAQLKAERRTQAIPVVIVSVVDERSRGLGLGAAEYLVKPISRQELRQALSWILPLGVEEARALVVAPDQAGTAAEQPMILLVEDNEESINTIQDYLLVKGYRVVVARDGAEAIQRAREERPDVILMDIQMPGMDGLEATRRIRADVGAATVPIIALTALAMPGDRERCLAAGVNEYLSKPVSLKGLVEVIEVQLNRSQIGKGNLA